MEWEPSKSIADYILENIEEEEILENKDLIRIVNLYKVWYKEGLAPTSKNFLYYDDNKISSLVVSIIQFPYEVSGGWKKYELTVPKPEDTYKNEVHSTIQYLKLRKIKQMITENQKAMEKINPPEEQLILLEMHQRLKKLEIEITRQLGTVILK